MAIFTKTATLEPGQDPGDISTSGLGSLASRLIRSPEVTNLLTSRNNIASGNRMYGGLYAEDPTEEELASGFLDISQAEGTPTYGIPEFDRYSYASRDFRSLPSLYELYLSGGLDDYVAGVDPSTGTVDTPVDTGGGGGGFDVIDTPVDVNTPFEQNLIDQGIGVQGAPGDPVVAPGEMPVTQEEMDAFNQIPVTQPMTGGVTGDDITVENIAQDQTPYDVPMDPSNPGASIENLIAAEQARTISGAPVVSQQLQDEGPTTGTISDDRMNEIIGGQPMAAGPFDYLQKQTPISEVQVLGGVSDEEKEKMANYIPSTFEADEVDEQGNLLQRGVEKLKSIIPNFDPIAAAIKLGVNTIVGKPVSLLVDVLGPMLPKDTSEDTFNRQFAIEGQSFQDIATSDPDFARRLQGYSSALNPGQNISGRDPFGRNTVSAFGDYEKALAEDLQYTGDNQFNLDKKSYAQAYFDKKGIADSPNEAKAFEEKYGISPTGSPVTRDRLIDEGIDAADEEPAPSGDGPQEVDAGTADVQDYADIYEPPTPAPAPSPAPSYSPPSPHRPDGDGGNQGGSTSSGGGYSRGDYGGRGHHWAKGGIVSLKNGKR